MLLQVLVCLRCARAAARTGVLSRRWRGLWARLPGLTFRGISAREIQAALSVVARPHAVSLLDIRIGSTSSDSDARAKSLLRAIARLSPEQLVFVLPQCDAIKPGRPVTILLPPFRRATSIELDTSFLCIKSPPTGELPALHMLSLSGNIVDLGAFLECCPRLRVLGVTFRGVTADNLDVGLAALEAAAALGLVVSRLGIEYKFDHINRVHSINRARFASLLAAAARLSPQELIFTNDFYRCTDADLPCFPLARSIEMNLSKVRFTQLRDGEFSMLERLALCGCTLVDLVTLVTRCPRLRVLDVTADKYVDDVTVHSLSLQELMIYVGKMTECQVIDIMTPLLKELTLYVHGCTNLMVSISAPMIEKVWWSWSYSDLALIFGFWSLKMLTLKTEESCIYQDGVRSNHPSSPHIHVLSLHVKAYCRLGAVLNFANEMKKLPVTNFSVLELHISNSGHVYGAFFLRLFRMHRIQTAIQSLKVILPWHEMPGELKCVENCPCDKPKNWRSQDISLDNLAEVEIDNFRGGERETELLTMIFKWAGTLQRMTVKISPQIKKDKFKACTMEAHNIFSAYPSVSCSLFRYDEYDELVQHKGIQSACS